MTVLAEVQPARLSRPVRTAANSPFTVLGSILVTGVVQVTSRLPFTPVPITGQTLGVLLVGAALGASRGAASLLLYLGEDAAGLPSSRRPAGAMWLVPSPPAGGYRRGFVAAPFVVGALARRCWDRGIGSAIGATLVGEIVICALGVPWLTRAVHVSGEKALTPVCTHSSSAT